MARSAVWNGSFRQVVVSFDLPLAAGPLDAANWTLVHSGGSATPSGASASGEQVTLQFASALVAESIEYDPPPFDVVGEPPNDSPAAGFTLPVS